MSAVLVSLIVSGWYGSNIGVLLLNKYLLSIYGFKYPVFLTFCHMLACSFLSYGLAASHAVQLQPVKTRQQLYKIGALALVFCVTVVLGNVSLKFIPVSFNQALGATTPAFTALLSAVMLRNRESPAVYASLIPVIVGIVIASGAEPMFNITGFTAALLATAGRALKSVLQGMMLSDSSDKMDSLSLLLYMAPIATAALVPITIVFEPQALANAVSLGSSSVASGFWLLLLFNSFLAYFVNLTNFLVTKYTSALTLQVLGNAKGVVAVIVSVMYFRNPVTVYSLLGYGITVTGVVLYSQAKKTNRSSNSETGRLINISVKSAYSSNGTGAGDLEQPRSPFAVTLNALLPAAGYNAPSDPDGMLTKPKLERGNEHPLQTSASGRLVGGFQTSHSRNLSSTLSSSTSDKIMARGFSSIFEA